MKDYFSAHSQTYAAFRPTYPKELYDFIFEHVRSKGIAWDCATGNGQVAQFLASHFAKVYATDISQKQLDQATKKENIIYSVERAEKTGFPDHHFDLITVAQALHWFDRDAFYEEVKRVCKPGGILAVWGYAMISISPKIDELVMEFYNGTVGPYWDNARRLVEDEYRSIPFPFEIIPSPKFAIKVEWTLEQLAGYLTSWSATQGFIRERGFDPVGSLIESLEPFWPEPVAKVIFPVFLKLGRIV
jgi:SAM-dependent methyltransferase